VALTGKTISLMLGCCLGMLKHKWWCRIDQLLEQVDQGSQVVAVEPIQIAEDIAVPRRDSDLTAWVRFSADLLAC